MNPIDKTSPLYNEDLAPVPEERRTWSLWNIAALWIGMSVCIPTYMLAGGMIKSGMNWWQALLTIALGNCIVLIPMLLNAHAGTKYGIPFPVLLRSSFGTLGANVPALLRALVACGWFGIQTWIGGFAIYTLHSVIFDFEMVTVGAGAIFGLSAGQVGCFLLFWVVNIAIILIGIDCIKLLETWSAPFLIIIGLGLLVWAISKVDGGLGRILSNETVLTVREVLRSRENLPQEFQFNFWTVFWPSLTAMVGFWATLSLNIPDFTRFAKSQKAQIGGQILGLPTTMALYSFIGIAVTSASVLIFDGKVIDDPVALLGEFKNPIIVGFSLFCLTIATLSTNIAANVVSPANDFSNLAPKLISFKTGGIITGVIGIVMMPWKLLQGNAYIFTWLIGYSSLLGAIAGVMIVDYYILRKCKLEVDQLYENNGEYSFGGSGFNWAAIFALIAGILPNVPGFLQAASGGSIQAPEFFNTLYTYAWFNSLLISAAAYIILSGFSGAMDDVPARVADPAIPVKKVAGETT